MSKITLNFFGETISINKPKSLFALRSEISELFCFSPEDASEILLTYVENGNKKVISNDEDLKTFLESKTTLLDLDISQSSKIYKSNLNQLQEENLKDKKALDELLKKKEELTKMKETKFLPEKKELKEIQEKIVELLKKKSEIRKRIFESVRQIEKDIRENDNKIKELQKKLGIKVEETEKPKQKPMFVKKVLNNKLRFAPPVIKLPITKPCPHVHPCFFPKKYHIHPNKAVKFAKTEIIDIPKDNTTMTESNNSNEEIDIKMRTIDDWGKCLLNKTKEITNKLAEKFKGLESLNISVNSNKEKKVEDKKEEPKKEVHRFIICDGCGMDPLVGKRYKCKTCHDFDYCEKWYEKNKNAHKHEFKLVEIKTNIERLHIIRRNLSKNMLHPRMTFNAKKSEDFPKKLEHCPTMGNIFGKQNVAKKVIHFGVECDQCKKFPIVGVRYKCAVCPDFDFCEDCEKKFADKHNHAFYKIYEPQMRHLIKK